MWVICALETLADEPPCYSEPDDTKTLLIGEHSVVLTKSVVDIGVSAAPCCEMSECIGAPCSVGCSPALDPCRAGFECSPPVAVEL